MSETVVTPAATEPATVVAPPATTEVAPADTDSLPQWARDALTKANAEAAKYRTQAKEAAEKAKGEAGAEYTTKVQELAAEKAQLAEALENSSLAVLKLSAAISVGIPGESVAEFADLLKGATQEEILAHAEKLKALFGAKSARPIDPTQGATGGADVEADPGLGRLRYAYSKSTTN